MDIHLRKKIKFAHDLNMESFSVIICISSNFPGGAAAARTPYSGCHTVRTIDVIKTQRQLAPGSQFHGNTTSLYSSFDSALLCAEFKLKFKQIFSEACQLIYGH